MVDNAPPTYRLVPDLPDLITEEDYRDAVSDSTLRIRITTGKDGIEVLGDSPLPMQLEGLLQALCPDCIEKTPCG